jgi:DMSO/TMAO reductase YedYZ heme-binding membrane subunit
MFAPAIWLIHQVATGQFCPVLLGGMTYWSSGVWATVLLLLALAITPALTPLRWGRLIVVQRMIGVTAVGLHHRPHLLPLPLLIRRRHADPVVNLADRLAPHLCINPVRQPIKPLVQRRSEGNAIGN